MWLTFAPIPNYTAKYYGVETSAVDFFSVVYFIVSLLVGFVSIAVLDMFGLKVSVSGVEWCGWMEPSTLNAMERVC